LLSQLVGLIPDEYRLVIHDSDAVGLRCGFGDLITGTAVAASGFTKVTEFGCRVLHLVPSDITHDSAGGGKLDTETAAALTQLMAIFTCQLRQVTMRAMASTKACEMDRASYPTFDIRLRPDGNLLLGQDRLLDVIAYPFHVVGRSTVPSLRYWPQNSDCIFNGAVEK
jgi:hypothetical protein